MGQDKRLKLGNHKFNGWVNRYIKPSGKFWKRQAAKKARKSDVVNGGEFKKKFGWFEWC